MVRNNIMKQSGKEMCTITLINCDTTRNTFSTSCLVFYLPKCSAQGCYIPGQIKAPTAEQNTYFKGHFS
jgi:hypothetical protein